MTCRAARNPIKQATISKAQILNAIAELPDDATIEDAMERLYNLYKVEQGLAQVDAGQTVFHDEARKQMAE